MNESAITLPAREVPVLAECDVLVCGGGAAGCAAAVSAARHGADTIVVDKLGYLGGATVAQQVSHILSTNGVDFQGIWHEWIRAVRRRGGVAPMTIVPCKIRSGVDPEAVKYAWDDMLEEAGARQILHVWCSGAIVVDGACRGVVAETRAGRRAILAKRVIDATADGAVCASAGVPFDSGDGVNPWSQALTKVFRMGNVHWPEGGYPKALVESLCTKAAEAVEKGEFTSPLVATGRAVRYSANDFVHKSVVPSRTEMNVLPSRVLRVNPIDPWDLTRAEREGRADALQCAEFIRRYVPGFEESYLLDTNAVVGCRDSRRIHGIATATDDDVVNFRRHADGIARSSWEIDMWPGDSYSAPAIDQDSALGVERHRRMMEGDWFDIRYGAIVAAGVENLLVAGRCVSAERKAQGSLRIQQTCQSTGQAAGLAAVMSLDAGVPPSRLDPAPLVARLAVDRDVEPAFKELLRK